MSGSPEAPAGSRRITSRLNTYAERKMTTQTLLLRAHAEESPGRRQELLDQVVIVNLEVAEAIARRYRGRGIADEDLDQAAYEGLVKAVHKFDPEVRPDLLTYAVPTIRGELQRWFRDQGWTVRPPRRLQELQWHLSRSIDHLVHQLGREPTASEIGADLGVSADEVSEAIQAFGAFTPSSLDQPVGVDGVGTTLGETIADDDEAERAALEARIALQPALSGLSERDRQILHLRFVEERTQLEIGQELGVTQIQVSRLVQRILKQLRRDIAPDVARSPVRRRQAQPRL